MSDNLVDTSASVDGSQKDLANLRAIREILSYIHVDAVQDGHQEVAERIDFAMVAAEKILKNVTSTPPTAKTPDELVATAMDAPDQGGQSRGQT